MDETWKDITFGGVEGHWGIFDTRYVLDRSIVWMIANDRSSKKLKTGLTLPTCTHS